MSTYDDPTVSDQQLLDRVSTLRIRDSLSRAGDDGKARMAAAGCPPESYAPLTPAEHLDLLGAQRALELRLARRDAGILRALQGGASWPQIADAVGIDVEVLRARFRVWIAGQQRLHADIGIGLDDEQAAAAMRLLGDTLVLS